MKSKTLLSIVSVVAILIIAAVIMFVLSGLKEEPPKKPPANKSKVVNAVVLKKKDIPVNITAYGKLRSARPVTLFSEVSGILEKGDVEFRPANKFRKGDLIIKIDDRQTDLELKSMKSDFLNALATVLPEIKIDFPDEYKKWEDYFNSCSFDKKLPELPEASNQKIKLFLTRYNVYKLFFSVRNLEIKKEKHYITAPFNGSILSAQLREGATVRSGSQLGEIISLSEMEAELQVAVNDISWINKNGPVSLHSDEMNLTWSGKISRIGSSIDESTQTIPVYVTLSGGDADPVDGTFVKTALTGKFVKNAYTVPRQSVYEENYIYLIKNKRLSYLKTDIIKMETDNAIIKSGVADGDTLVTELMQGVADGMKAEAILNNGGEW